MNFKQFLNETPALDDFSRDEIKSMTDTYTTAMKFDHEVVGKIKGKDLILYKKGNNRLRYAILDHNNKKVLFMSGISLYGKPTQQLVWKDERSSITSTDIRKIFVDYILKEHKIILSDDLQSEGGKKFWHSLCRQYISSDKYEVGMLLKQEDEDSAKIRTKMVPFKKETFENQFEDAYEEENSHSQLYMRIK